MNERGETWPVDPETRETIDRLGTRFDQMGTRLDRLSEDLRGEIRSSAAETRTYVDQRIQASEVGTRVYVDERMQALAADSRRHFDVVAESLRADIRAVGRGLGRVARADGPAA